ncbi:hypothetical protein CIK05_10885 [Bdellovibrio sp. qaytius]|nr:hypothetical protein CIK05_10885 [Bdellovibrio sp. qaytius]
MELLKRADLLSSVGAGFLGAGIAISIQDALKSHVGVVLSVGIISHGSGMYLKHQIEKRQNFKPQLWENILYWGCWVALVLLLIYLIQGWMKL